MIAFNPTRLCGVTPCSTVVKKLNVVTDIGDFYGRKRILVNLLVLPYQFHIFIYSM